MATVGYCFVECPHCGDTNTMSTYIEQPSGRCFGTEQIVHACTCQACRKRIPETTR